MPFLTRYHNEAQQYAKIYSLLFVMKRITFQYEISGNHNRYENMHKHTALRDID
jgi:hypothetical protein